MSQVEGRWPPRQMDGGEGVGCTKVARVSTLGFWDV